MSPVPTNPTRVGGSWARKRAASAADAAVRAALITEASRQAYGYPVPGSLRTRTPDARGSRASTFCGKLEIHLTPSTSPLIAAGSAMIRDDGRSGKRRKYDGG